jgi:hypothetical protein
MVLTRLATLALSVLLSVLLSGGMAGTLAAADTASRAETREVIVKPREPRPDVFVLAGRVRPAYEKKPAILQRRNCASCSWFAFERFRTDADSRFRRSVPDLEPGRKKVCYRVKVPASKGFARSVSEVHCIGAIGQTVRG